MISNIFVFEDDKYSNFLPLVYLRPVYDLISGAATLLAKIVRNFPEANISLHCREYLKNIVKQNHPGIGVNNINTGMSCLLLNGRLLANGNLDKILKLDDRDRIFIDEYEEVVAAYFDTQNLYIVKNLLDDVFSSKQFITTFRNKAEITHVEARLIEYPWELVNESAQQVTNDFEAFVPSGLMKGDIHNQAAVLDEFKIYVGENSKIYPGVTLNAKQGPIYIGDNCSIKPHTYIEGPVYIGNSTAVINSTILPGTSIGPKSYIKGELANTILHGYSKIDNAILKYSYLTDAVDIDRNSFNQDYLSPFSNVPHVYIDGYELKTSENHLGLLAADFSKIGANIIINAGSVIGISTYFETGNDTMPKYLPSFIRQTSVNRFDELSLTKVIEMIKHFLSLKDIEFTKAELDLVEYVYSKFSYDRKVSKIIY